MGSLPLLTPRAWDFPFFLPPVSSSTRTTAMDSRKETECINSPMEEINKQASSVRPMLVFGTVPCDWRDPASCPTPIPSPSQALPEPCAPTSTPVRDPGAPALRISLELGPTAALPSEITARGPRAPVSSGSLHYSGLGRSLLS
ncbi:hypothetical protein FA10DRAFT_201380 [Acaromyces ingoldii]|uniref:Uncharacterized protein n=1 Tax=Acaromyces ingoldii TaxID=215250 RepID=A0A316YBA1_9BASI|nr:hypothetical protein FA10DRAFT_201380 [Acaromyces ingoldii]PWN86856.1 hypothetical protein FA10DRAFT_201380 [Acaromyces ingoldii]